MLVEDTSLLLCIICSDTLSTHNHFYLEGSHEETLETYTPCRGRHQVHVKLKKILQLCLVMF